MAPVVSKVVGYYNIVTPTDGEDVEDTKEFSAGGNGWEFTCELDTTFEFGNGISPSSIEVNVKTKKITVKFS